MSKKRNSPSSLPPGAEKQTGGLHPVEEEVVVASAHDASEAEPEKPTLKTTEKKMTVPLVENIGGYFRRRVDSRFTGAQAEALKCVQAGLENRGERLANGRHVTTPAHAIQWMLENIK